MPEEPWAGVQLPAATISGFSVEFGGCAMNVRVCAGFSANTVGRKEPPPCSPAAAVNGGDSGGW